MTITTKIGAVYARIAAEPTDMNAPSLIDAETYARGPDFYSGTFCATCRNHFPVGDDGEFTWTLDGEKIGT